MRKMKRLWQMGICCLLLLTMSVPVFGGITNADEWAVSTVESAYKEGLVPQILLNQAKSSISRKDFCTMAVLFYEKVTGKKGEPSRESPFVDCKGTEVAFAYEIGIISGVSATKFNPDGYLTREQMAIIMTRAIKACGLIIPNENGKTGFADIATLSETSKEAVQALAKANIASGQGKNFCPQKNLAVQEAVVIFYRAHAKLMGKEIPSIIVSTKDAKVTVAGRMVYLGQSKTEFEAEWGKPSRMEKDAYDLDRSVYLNDYQNLLLVTWKDDVVAEIFTNGKDFSYGTVKALADIGTISNIKYLDKANGMALLDVNGYDAKVLLSHENSVDGILLQEKDFSTGLKKQYNIDFAKDTKQTVFDLVNAARVRDGIAALQIDEIAAKTAEEQSLDMYKGNYVGYTDSKGEMVFQRMEEKGIEFDMAAEIVAKIDGDAIMIYHDWMRRIGSRSNLLNPYLINCGIGIYNQNYTFYVTADFYSPKK